MPEDNYKNISQYQQLHQNRYEIRGFNFDSSQNGRRVISIKADRFTIKKKKIGFLSFSLMNEAKFENAVIHIYGRSLQPDKSEVGGREKTEVRGQRSEVGGRSGLSEKRSDNSLTDIKVQHNLTFKDVFSKGNLPSFQVKKISSIVMEPVCLEFHDEQSSVTRISAASAVIRFKNRYIFFKGNVRVVSGERILTTSRLSLFPEKAVIRTEQHFILKTPEKKLEGERMTSDIFLKPVFSSKKAKSGPPEQESGRNKAQETQNGLSFNQRN